MTACTNHGGKARRVVTAALVGVLSVGTVPMVALATEASDGIAPMFITEGNAFEGAAVKADFSHGRWSATFNNATDDVCDLNYVENVPVALDKVTISFAGTSDVGNLVIDADAEDDDYDVAYYRRGNDGKPADDSAITSDIVSVGKYVAVVTPKEGTTYEGNVLYIPFDINERAIPGVAIVDDTVTYNAEAHDFAFTSNGKLLTEGLDYDVYYVADGHGYTEDQAVDVKNVGKYVAVLTGKGAYEGTVQLVKGIEVEQLNLTTLTNNQVQGVVSASETEPENTFAITIDGKVYQGDDPIMSELKGDIDLSAAQPTGTTWKNNGSYLYKLQAADSTNTNITGSKQFSAFKVANEVSFNYGGSALSDMDLVIDDDVLWNSSKVSASGQDGTVGGATISYASGQIQGRVYYADGTVVSGADFAAQIAYMNVNAGTYYVQLWVDGSNNGYELGGQTMVKVTVWQDAVDADAKAAVLYDVDSDGRKEVVSSVSTTYQKGHNVKSDITVSVKDSAGNTLSEAGGDYAVTYYNEDGIAVSKVEDAGTYTLKLTSNKYKLSGTTEMTVTVAPMDLSTVRSGQVTTTDFDVAGVGDYEYLPWLKKSYTIGGSSKSASLDLEYLVPGADASKASSWKSLPMDVVKVAITKDGKEVERIDSEGVYIITFEARNADAENNYVMPSDLEVLCVKDGSYGSADHTKFADVKWNDYFIDSVTWVSDKGYMTGYGNSDLFGSLDKITRADVVGTLYKMAGAERLHLDDKLYDAIVGWKSFDDVDGKQYYGRAIAWAKYAGIVNGHDGKFRPDETITREEFAAMLSNYAKKYGVYEAPSADALDDIADASSVSPWMTEAVSWAVENGIMGNAGSVWAQDEIVRADVAGMIWHFAS